MRSVLLCVSLSEELLLCDKAETKFNSDADQMVRCLAYW